MKKTAIALLMLVATAAAAGAQTIVGEPIHRFGLTDLDGKMHRDTDYRGKILGIFLLGHD